MLNITERQEIADILEDIIDQKKEFIEEETVEVSVVLKIIDNVQDRLTTLLTKWTKL